MDCSIDMGQHIFATTDFQMSNHFFCKNCRNRIGFFFKIGISPERMAQCKFCGGEFKISWMGWIFIFFHPLFYIFSMVSGFYIFNSGGVYDLIFYFTLANVFGILFPAIIYYFFAPVVFFGIDS